MSAEYSSTHGACNDTTPDLYIYAASGVGVASSLLTIVAVLIGRQCCGKPTHRFFLYYSLAAFLHSTFEFFVHFTCNISPLLHQSNVGVVSYFDGILVLLLCWISAYLLLVGVYQHVRLQGWKIEAICMATVLVLPLAHLWKPIYVAASPGAEQTYGCRLPAARGNIVDLTIASVEYFLLILACVAAGITFAKLVVGSCQKGGSYHRSYLKTFQTLLPFFVFLLVANLAGFYRVALSVVVAAKNSCPAPMDVMLDLFPLTFVSLPVCYLFLACRIRCCAERESAWESVDTVATTSIASTTAGDYKV